MFYQKGKGRISTLKIGWRGDSMLGSPDGFDGELHSPVSLLLGLQPWGCPIGTHLMGKE